MSIFDKIAEVAVSVGNTVKDGVVSTGNTVAGGFESAGNSFAGAVESSGKIAWEGASDEARALGRGIETTGMKISDGFIAGAGAVKTGMGEGVEKVVEGAEAVKGFVEKNVCNIFVGSALSAVFVALAAGGQEETSVATIAALSASGFADNVALNTAAKALASVISTPVYSIPGVSSSGLSQSELETAITFLIVKACKQKPKLVVGSAGQFLAGVLIYGITNLVCEGKIPGGYQVWKGANASMFGTPGNVQPATPGVNASTHNTWARFRLQFKKPVISHPGWSGSHAFDVKFYLTIYPDLAKWNTTNTLAPGDVLRPGEYISSTSGAYYLTITSDGQLCVFGNTPSNELGVSWRSGSKSDGPVFAVMQTDGNFCLFEGTPSSQGKLLWQSATSGQTKFAILQDDGHLCVYAGNSQATQGAFAWGSLHHGGVVPPVPPRVFGVNLSSIAAHNVSPEIAHRLSRVRGYAAALDHWLTVGISEGRRGSREFDLSFYMQYYTDMPAAFGTNHAAVLDHWLTFGISEGRRGSREFDLSFYMQYYTDMPAAFGTNHAAILDHWLNTGLPVEGRRGSREFDVSFYLQSNPDLGAVFGNNYVAALDHWIIQGVREGRKGAPSA
ncbi:MAG TPA: hypothetical protein VM095_12975 [Pyrinomonadaceae bacterium]|nr:hypothetical protein [Pyrinomonadaceae bacterium]